MEYSLVMTVYNDESEINNILKEITNQKLSPKEIIIVDGGSTDNTLNCIKSLIKIDSKLILIEGKRLNIAQGFNRAIEVSSCEYIGIAATGNHYNKYFFSNLMKAMDEKRADVAYASIKGYRRRKFSAVFIDAFLGGKGLKIPSNHGIVVKKQIFEETGGFYEKFIYAGEDAEFYKYVENKKKYRFIYVPEAHMFWEVPQNIDDLKKQRKGYIIAELQMYGYVLPWRKWKIFCTIFYDFYRKDKQSDTEKIKVYRAMTDLIYSVRNIKFASKKWRVTRSN